MKIVTTIAELKKWVHEAKRAGKTVGLVPTMGYLHEGHLTLMRDAKVEHDLVVTTIFVNPLQFGPQEDFAAYPRDLDRDAKLAESAGVDILFVPSVEEMYPGGDGQVLTYVDVKLVSDTLCGASRPGHFRGVATVVAKLFNIAEADVAYFGQKDAQQVVVIRRMVEDLNMNIRIVTVATVRETDGLAMSSRNKYLNPDERKAALVLSRSLQLAKNLIFAGERDAVKIKASMVKLIEGEPLAKIDYVSIVDAELLAETIEIKGASLIALAVKFGKTRLIDNILWEGK